MRFRLCVIRYCPDVSNRVSSSPEIQTFHTVGNPLKHTNVAIKISPQTLCLKEITCGASVQCGSRMNVRAGSEQSAPPTDSHSYTEGGAAGAADHSVGECNHRLR